MNAFGVTLPPDAAPPDKQFLRLLGTEGTSARFLRRCLQAFQLRRPAGHAVSVLDKNFQILPGAALSWEGSADGKTWTYHLDPNLMWSDGNPVTADDYVFTFQYQADPKIAWDFTWFWAPIHALERCCRR